MPGELWQARIFSSRAVHALCCTPDSFGRPRLSAAALRSCPHHGFLGCTRVLGVCQGTRLRFVWVAPSSPHSDSRSSPDAPGTCHTSLSHCLLMQPSTELSDVYALASAIVTLLLKGCAARMSNVSHSCANPRRPCNSCLGSMPEKNARGVFEGRPKAVELCKAPQAADPVWAFRVGIPKTLEHDDRKKLIASGIIAGGIWYALRAETSVFVPAPGFLGQGLSRP